MKFRLIIISLLVFTNLQAMEPIKDNPQPDAIMQKTIVHIKQMELEPNQKGLITNYLVLETSSTNYYQNYLTAITSAAKKIEKKPVLWKFTDEESPTLLIKYSLKDDGTLTNELFEFTHITATDSTVEKNPKELNILMISKFTNIGLDIILLPHFDITVLHRTSSRMYIDYFKLLQDPSVSYYQIINKDLISKKIQHDQQHEHDTKLEKDKLQIALKNEQKSIENLNKDALTMQENLKTAKQEQQKAQQELKKTTEELKTTKKQLNELFETDVAKNAVTVKAPDQLHRFNALLRYLNTQGQRLQTSAPNPLKNPEAQSEQIAPENTGQKASSRVGILFLLAIFAGLLIRYNPLKTIRA